jgi:hypothetical protein
MRTVGRTDGRSSGTGHGARRLTLHSPPEWSYTSRSYIRFSRPGQNSTVCGRIRQPPTAVAPGSALQRRTPRRALRGWSPPSTGRTLTRRAGITRAGGPVGGRPGRGDLLGRAAQVGLPLHREPGDVADTHRVTSKSALLARGVVGEKTTPRALRALHRMVREDGRPSRSAVASTMALGSASPARIASASPSQQLLVPGGREVGIQRLVLMRHPHGGHLRRCRGSCRR